VLRFVAVDAYILIGEENSGKSSMTRCLTGSGRSRTRLIATVSVNINVYVHLMSLHEDKKHKKTPADFEQRVEQEDCDAVLFSLWPHSGNGCPDADTYLQYFVGRGWNIVRVACLGLPVATITTPLAAGTVLSFPSVNPTPVNEVAAQVRAHFGWV
jgi:hypothetical protein